MFSLFKKKDLSATKQEVLGKEDAQALPWVKRLAQGLKKTSSNLAQVFVGTQIDEALFEQLEEALLLSDAGVKATDYLLKELQAQVKKQGLVDPKAVKALLSESMCRLLTPLEGKMDFSRASPFVIMVAGVNGAGKTTSVGKLTRFISDSGASVLLAAADTFRAAAKEQLQSWATQSAVDIISQAQGDPAAVSFDAVSAAKARGRDVVLIDTAGRLPTQLHLMQELQKIKRVIQKAQALAPHETLLVIDGNTGQNALTQVKAFDEALDLTGLIVTKLDGTAKGGAIASIALWGLERAVSKGGALPVYFIGVGEKLEDLQAFNAQEFCDALLN